MARNRSRLAKATKMAMPEKPLVYRSKAMERCIRGEHKNGVYTHDGYQKHHERPYTVYGNSALSNASSVVDRVRSNI